MHFVYHFVAYSIIIIYFCSTSNKRFQQHNKSSISIERDGESRSIRQEDLKHSIAECTYAIQRCSRTMRCFACCNTSTFDVNPKSLGYTTCTYIGLNLERGSMYKKVVERLSAIPEVVECHFTTGPYTILLKLYARDNEQLMDLLNNQLQGIPGVVSTETLISLEQSIKREIPITEEL